MTGEIVDLVRREGKEAGIFSSISLYLTVQLLPEQKWKN